MLYEVYKKFKHFPYFHIHNISHYYFQLNTFIFLTYIYQYLGIKQIMDTNQ